MKMMSGGSLTYWCSMIFGLSLVCGCGKKEEPTPEPRVVESTPVWESVEETTPTEPRPTPIFDSVPTETLEMEEADEFLPQAETTYRPADTRPTYDSERLHALEIDQYVSERLILYTDIDPKIAATLPPLVDQLYDRWVDYFGELPPNREGTAYQLTGYLIKDKDRFRAAGMLPEDLPYFAHGRHRGAEFWLNEQEYDYYRRHLLLHEATHCFMTTMPGKPPGLWYLEGMAEFFGTHTLNNGTAQFGVFPEESTNYTGFGRIQMIQEEVEAGRYLSFDEAVKIGNPEFSQSRTTPYAWSWALCVFLDQHPRYQERFRSLGQHLVGDGFFELLYEEFSPDIALLRAEWHQFIHDLDYGYDIAANSFNIFPKPTEVIAKDGWQSTGVEVKSGQQLTITATGQVELAQSPKPWISEPNGITIRYANGKPIGLLQAAILGEQGQFKTRTVSLEATFPAPIDGILYLRVNDFPGERSDNTGSYSVTISNHK